MRLVGLDENTEKPEQTIIPAVAYAKDKIAAEITQIS
jgi:hypothetical protein